MKSRRELLGVFRRPEQYCVRLLVANVPQTVNPDHLTAVAILGAMIAAGSLVACRLSAWFLIPFYAGLVLHWLGDSLDGALARYRQCERHRAGFLIDRACDLASFCVIIFALGLSPYMPLAPALMVLVGYLVHSVYGLLRTVVYNRQVVGFGGIGATEGRILIGVWAGVIQFSAMNLSAMQINGVEVFTVVAGAVLLLMIGIFISRVAADVARVSETDRSLEARRSNIFADNVIPINRESIGRRGVVAGRDNEGGMVFGVEAANSAPAFSMISQSRRPPE